MGRILDHYHEQLGFDGITITLSTKRGWLVVCETGGSIRDYQIPPRPAYWHCVPSVRDTLLRGEVLVVRNVTDVTDGQTRIFLLGCGVGAFASYPFQEGGETKAIVSFWVESPDRGDWEGAAAAADHIRRLLVGKCLCVVCSHLMPCGGRCTCGLECQC